MAPPPSATATMRAVDLLDAYRAGTLSPVEVVDEALARIDRWQPTTGAFVYVDADGARTAAHESAARWRAGRPAGALDGVPVSIKDSLHVLGMPTTWGSRLLGHLTQSQDETPVARLRAAGAVLLGKTHCPEFTMHGYTVTPRHGVTRNPWRPELTPGGSSGGAVAALAAGCGALALATDGGGSIRRPAGYTALAGFKPGAGVVPRAGGVPALYLDHEVVGPIARCVDDLALAMQVLAAPGAMAIPRPPAAERPLRVLAVDRFGDHPVDPAIHAAFHRTVARCVALGARVERADGFELAERVNATWMRLPAAGLAWMADRAARIPELTGGFDVARLGDDLRAVLEAGRTASAVDLFEAMHAAHEAAEAMDRCFGSCDLLLTPSAAAMPWPAERPHPATIDGCAVGPRGHAVFTALANAAKLPALSLPCAFSKGLPIGVQLIGPRGADAAVLAAGRRLEAAIALRIDWPRVPS